MTTRMAATVTVSRPARMLPPGFLSFIARQLRPVTVGSSPRFSRQAIPYEHRARKTEPRIGDFDGLLGNRTSAAAAVVHRRARSAAHRAEERRVGQERGWV